MLSILSCCCRFIAIAAAINESISTLCTRTTWIGNSKCVILRLSAPLKEQYAKEHDLDFQQLLDASDYKEKYREDMIRWGEEKRKQNAAYFCDIVCQAVESQSPVWIISDARRKTDVQYFKDRYSDVLLTIRVTADEQVRKQRGWVFTPGVDDAESECDLDGTYPDIILPNNTQAHSQELDSQLETLCFKIKDKFSKTGDSYRT